MTASSKRSRGQILLPHLGTWLAKKNRKQVWLVKNADLSAPFISQLVNQEKGASMETVLQICGALKIRLRDLLSDPAEVEAEAETAKQAQAIREDAIALEGLSDDSKDMARDFVDMLRRRQGA